MFSEPRGTEQTHLSLVYLVLLHTHAFAPRVIPVVFSMTPIAQTGKLTERGESLFRDHNVDPVILLAIA